MKIAIVTDSSANISDSELKKYSNLLVLPLSIIFQDNRIVLDNNKDITNVELSKILKKENVSTSQTSIGLIETYWKNLLKEYDKVINIGISQKISGQYSTSLSLSQKEEFKNKVFVYDSLWTSIPLKSLVFHALDYVKKSTDIKELFNQLNVIRKSSKIIFFINDIQYLAKGGRVSASVVLYCKVLKGIPILEFKNGTIEKKGKCRNFKKEVVKQLQELKNNCDSDTLYLVYNEFKMDNTLNIIKEKAKKAKFKHIIYEQAPNILMAHVGPYAFGLSCLKTPNIKGKINEK